MKKAIYSIAVLALLIGGAAYGDNCGTHKKADSKTVKAKADSDKSPDIVTTAIESGKFEVLVSAVKAAGLVDALKGDGPFTVFAPTDEAFAELPEGALEGLLDDTEKLKSILTYHVVEGAVTSDQVVKIKSAKTLNGKPIMVAVKDGRVMINDVNVIATDIMCSNGVIHVVDKVIMPIEESR
jgi:uncharacterized surface protein with fasciclin (FAS1) repeats